jgi:hypothetical protein
VYYLHKNAIKRATFISLFLRLKQKVTHDLGVIKKRKKGDGRDVVLLSNNHQILFSRHNVFNQL